MSAPYRVLITRQADLGKQTTGKLEVYDGNVCIYTCNTIERSWNENKRLFSCIPEGKYKAQKRISEKYKQHFHVLNVPDRGVILIHVMNFYTESYGCIGVGDGYSDLNKDGEQDVLNSRKTLDYLLKILPDNFDIQIVYDNEEIKAKLQRQDT